MRQLVRSAPRPPLPLNALAVGEEGAQVLRVDLNRESRRIIVLEALLTGAAVSFLLPCDWSDLRSSVP